MPSCRLLHTTNDSLDIRSFRPTQLFDCLRHTRHGMFTEQLQHTDILADSTTRTVPIFQPCSQFAEDRWKFPIAVHVRVIQCRRTPRKRYQIMQRIENLVAGLITAVMRGHDLSVVDDVHAIDVAFDRHRLEGHRAWHAVRHVVEACELILVNFRRLSDAGIKAMLRQRSRLLQVVLQPLANRTLRVACWSRLIVSTAVPQVFVQLLKVLHARNRSSPASLQRFHAILDDRFFVAARRHAEQRFKYVVAGQGRVAPVQLAVTATQQGRRYCCRVVPPDLSWNTIEKLERLHHAFQNRFGSFRRQSDRKRCVGIRPHQNQHRNLSSPVGKININLAEVRFQPLAGIMVQRDKRLAFFGPMLLHEPANRVVSTSVGVFITQPLEDPHCRVPLLRRGRFILGQNLPNQIIKRPQLRSRLPFPFPIRPWLAFTTQNLADLLS